MHSDGDNPRATVALPDARRRGLQLLVSCAVPPLTPAGAEPVGQLASNEIDWDWTIRTAIANGVSSLLHRSLAQSQPAGVPPDVTQRLHSLFIRSSARNIRLTRELLRILDHLKEAGLRALPFKGPALAVQAYGDPNLRHYADLDILVAPGDLKAAKDVLLSKGFHHQIHFSPSEEAAYVAAGGEYVLAHPSRGFEVELDCGLGPDYFGFRIDVERILEHANSVEIEGRNVPTVAADDLLPLLCMHGVKHCWNQLIWVADIAALVAHIPSEFWVELLREARHSRSERTLLLGLCLAGNLLGCHLPPAVDDAIRAQPVVPRVSALCQEQLLTGCTERAPWSRKLRIHLSTRDRLRDRLRYVFRLCFTPSMGDWRAVRLPPRLRPLYYAVRPVRLVAVGLGRLIRPRPPRGQPGAPGS